MGNSLYQQKDPSRGYYPDYERPMVVSRFFDSSSTTSKLAFPRKPVPTNFGSYEPLPKPRPQEQTRRDLPVPKPVDKPVGYYLILQRPSRSIAEERSKPLPAQGGKSGFTFGCLPDKKPRAGPQREPEVVQKQPAPRFQRPPQPPTQERSMFAYYPVYEVAPATYLKTLDPLPGVMAQNTTNIRKNPRGQYPDYQF